MRRVRARQGHCCHCMWRNEARHHCRPAHVWREVVDEAYKGESPEEGKGTLSSLLFLLCGDEVMGDGDGDGDGACMCGKGMWRDEAKVRCHHCRMTCRC